jgi:hypothetical protein
VLLALGSVREVVKGNKAFYVSSLARIARALESDQIPLNAPGCIRVFNESQVFKKPPIRG